MARVVTEGFEWNDWATCNNGNYSLKGTPVWSSTEKNQLSGAGGTRSLRMDQTFSTDRVLLHTLGPIDEGYLRVYFRYAYFQSAPLLEFFERTTTDTSGVAPYLGRLFAIWTDTTAHTLRLYVAHDTNGAQTERDDTAAILGFNTWYRLEVYWKIAVAGKIDVRIDGADVMTYSGDTSINDSTAPGGVGGVQFAGTGNGSSVYTYYDDLAINDITGTANNSWPGKGYIQILSPSADGTTNDWTASSGDRYAAVDEFPTESSSDYVEASATEQVQLFQLPDLPAAARSVNSVEVGTKGNKSGSTITNLQHVVRVSGTNYVSSNHALIDGPSRAYDESKWPTSPATSSKWTVSEVNGLEAGVKSKA